MAKLNFVFLFFSLVCLFKNGTAQTTFTNNSPITTYSYAPGNPFPSELVVSGLNPYTTKVVVTLHGVSIPSIVCNQVYIESPTGQIVCLFSKSGSAFFVTEGALTFDQDATNIPPDSYQGNFLPGTYRPSIRNSEALPADISDNLHAFNDYDPNGTWKLYENGFIPDAPASVGQIASWSLTITSTDVPPLPLSLTKFEARLQNGIAVLDWETAREQNTDFFEIERSDDGRSFEALGKVRASGNSNELVQYTYTDMQPMAGGNYYRLKMADQDKTVTYSDVRELHLSTGETYIYPNPFKEQLIISHAKVQHAAVIRIVTITGMEALRQQLDQTGRTIIDVAHLPVGVYYALMGDRASLLIKK